MAVCIGKLSKIGKFHFSRWTSRPYSRVLENALGSRLHFHLDHHLVKLRHKLLWTKHKSSIEPSIFLGTLKYEVYNSHKCTLKILEFAAVVPNPSRSIFTNSSTAMTSFWGFFGLRKYFLQIKHYLMVVTIVWNWYNFLKRLLPIKWCFFWYPLVLDWSTIWVALNLWICYCF